MALSDSSNQATSREERRGVVAKSYSSSSESSDELAQLELTDDNEEDQNEDLNDDDDTLDDLTIEQQVESLQQQVGKKSVAYVETSLDDLSYSSSSTNEEDTNRQDLPISIKKASTNSADEEDERRLLVQLQNEQRKRYQEKLVQEQQQQQQQQQQLRDQRQQQRVCAGHAQPDDGEEEAPEVPVRRSSQVNRRVNQERRIRPPPAFDSSQLPRPLLAKDEWRRRRPSQPPPPPPPPLPARYTSDASSEEAEPQYRSVPNKRTPVAPKNIWSPSSSSIASSSNEDSLNMVAKVAPPTSSSISGPMQTLADMSSPSPQNTVVERQRRLASADSDGAEDNNTPQLTSSSTTGEVQLAERSSQIQQAHSGEAQSGATTQQQQQQTLADGIKSLEDEARENESGAPIETNWRSYSVSLAAERKTSASPDIAFKASKAAARSYSIATTTLASTNQMPISCSDRPLAQQSKYWTLPSNSNNNGCQQLQQSSMGFKRVVELEKQSYMLDEQIKRSHESVATTSFKPLKSAAFDSRQRNLEQHHNATATRNEAKIYEQSKGEEMYSGSNHQKDDWFRHMYKQMHTNKQTPEKSLLQAVNSQPDPGQIRIKLKSPKTDHRFSPSYYSEEDFERRRDKNSVSPSFKPGNICDYLPGQSSISQHERNLAQSRSGPQTPISSNLYGELADEPHERRCVFSNLLKDPELGLERQKEIVDDPIEDPRKQYVAVQQGRDIPLKGLRKPAPQANMYKVGPAPFIEEKWPLQADHRVAKWQTSSNWQEDLYKDFDSLYESMSKKDSSVCEAQLWSRSAVFETDALAKSLIEVEEAMNRIVPDCSPLPSQSQISPTASSTYGKLISHRTTQASPMLSIGQSETTTNRADSRDTNFSYQNGPALVEEMTLSDLEDEISSSLLASKENSNRLYFSDGEQLLKSRRNRNPLRLPRYTNRLDPNHPSNCGYHSDQAQLLEAAYLNRSDMFSDDSINIHYRAPTSKLLKMNTFNEFELNRIKKFYNDELASRLQRSKSTRLASSQAPAGSTSDWPAHFGEQRRQTQSAERLQVQPASRRFIAPESPDSACVDLNRYQRAFLAKGAQLSRRTVRFGRALFDFQAKSDRELSIRRGDLVELLELIDHSWARVEDCQSGLQGLVPLSYIDYSVGCAVAKRDVRGQQRGGVAIPHEAPILAMSKGEPITLIRRLSGHWYEASNTRQAMGLVWSNDLDIIKQPVLIAKQPEVVEAEEAFEEEILVLDSGERLLARRRAQSASGARNPETCCAYSRCSNPQVRPCAPAYATCGPQCCRTSQKSSEFRRSSSSPYIASAAQQQTCIEPEERTSSSSTAADELPRLFRAKYTYLPRQKDELRLTPGEILLVVHQCDDGWFIGSSYSSKQMGTFPGNFVEPI